MVTYNQNKYIKYKTKQELLNRIQVNLVLDKDIAETLQKYMKGERKAMFEHKLKSYFLEKPLINKLQNCKNDDLSSPIPNIHILMSEFQEQLQEINNTMEILQKKLEGLISERYHDENDVDSTQLRQKYNSPQILKKSSKK